MGYGQLLPVEYRRRGHRLLPEAQRTDQAAAEHEHPEGAYYTEKKYAQPRRYRTPSGKIELYSQTLADNGYDPIPNPVEPSQSPVSTPEMLRRSSRSS